jgi:putative ABC transport system permease protein
MFAYNLKLAVKSMRRNPILTALMVAAIGVGIGMSMTTLSVFYLMSDNPIPEKSELLFAVQLDSWNPLRPFESDRPERPPHQLTYRDSTALLNLAAGARQTAMFESSLIIEPDSQGELPFEADARVTTSDFFPMFNVPFRYGSGWDSSADQASEAVVVLTKELNERLYGGEDSVGRFTTMQGMRFRVIGVIEEWEPTPRFYDPINGAFQSVQEMFVPLALTPILELGSVGSDWGWKSEQLDSFADWLQSESVWLQYWTELEDPSLRESYLGHLDAYVNEQKKLGRFARPLNNRVNNVMEWLDYHEVVARDSRILLGLSFLFLMVCLLSTIALLLTKFIGKTAESSLRRALGASRKAIFRQQIVEVGLIGLTGGAIGLGLAVLGLQAIQYLYDAPDGLVSMDWVLVMTAIVLSIGSSMMAGIYPAWRVCSIEPASQLKTQ